MARLVLWRLATIPLVLIAVTFLVQCLSLLVPGDPAVTLAGGEDASLERIEAIREQLNLDDPLFISYGRWVGNAVRGDFGESIVNGTSVVDEIQRRLPVTLGLGLVALAMIIPMALIGGFASAIWRARPPDHLLLAGSSFAMAAPSFVVAIILVGVFAVQLGWMPAFGYVPFTDSPPEWLHHLILPGIALALAPAARLARTLRGSLVDAFDGPYVRTAWAKGAAPSAVLGKHALKNALVPTVTVLALQLDILLGGSLIIENVFSIPGLGSYMATAVQGNDLPIVQAVTVLFAVMTVLINLAVDIVYGLLNPKVRVA